MAEACDNAWMYSVKAYGLSQGIVVADGFECRGLPPGPVAAAAARWAFWCEGGAGRPNVPYCIVKRPISQRHTARFAV